MKVIDKWAAEFFIRRQHNPRVSPANLLSALRLEDSPDCLKLKISSVLRDISDSLIRGTIDEGTLDLLEILGKLLLLQKRSGLTESHKSAYCWMAAECTLRFMWPLSASDGLFSDAVERIWTKRVGVLKESGSGLVTQELLKWEADMKMALEDPEVYQRIRETNIRYAAISFLTQLLKGQWELLGSSTLESVAQRRFRKRKAENNVENGDEGTERLESDTIDQANERRGSGDGEDGNGNIRDVEGVGCLENYGINMVNEQHGADEEPTMGAQEQEHEPSLDKGDAVAASELKEFLLEIQRQIDPSTSHVQEPSNAINHSVDFNRTGTNGQDNDETPGSVSEKGSGSQGTSSGRVRPHLLTPVPLNVVYHSQLKKANSSVRRRKKYWTPEEVEALREGVKQYGRSWKDIKNSNPVVFAERTEVDLKDKWRNLTR